jgi:hypothetical protein
MFSTQLDFKIVHSCKKFLLFRVSEPAGKIISPENDAAIMHTDEEISGLVICRSIKHTCNFLPFSSEWFGRLQAEFT